jgi:hypothetical protein
MASFNVISESVEFNAAYDNILADSTSVMDDIANDLRQGVTYQMRAEFMGEGVTVQFYHGMVNFKDRHIHEVTRDTLREALCAAVAARLTVSRDGPWDVALPSYR